MRPSETAASRYGLQPQPPSEPPPPLKPDPGVTSAKEAEFCRKYKDNWSVIVKEKWQRRLDHLRRELVVSAKLMSGTFGYMGESLGCKYRKETMIHFYQPLAAWSGDGYS